MFPNKIAVVIAALLIVVAGLVGYSIGIRVAPEEVSEVLEQPEAVACTMEAKMCPDGSYVGRIGPRCEFAPCPLVTVPIDSTVTLEARIGETVSAFGVVITPEAVLEDSRCPVDVVCIQAGTVRVRASLVSGMGTAVQEMKLGETYTTEAESITFASVVPVPVSTDVVEDSAYQFTFVVEAR
jgi:hypothetical protein